MDDRILLAVLKHRKYFDSLGEYVRLDAQEPVTKAMVQAFAAYFKEFPDRRKIDTAPFYTWLTQFHLKKTTPDTVQRIQAVLRAIEPDPGEHDRDMILKGLTEREFVQDLFHVCQRWDDGDEIEVFEEAKDIFDRHSELLRRRVADPWEAADFDTLFSEEAVMDKAVFPWLVPQMNKSIGHGALGEFDILGAGPGAGKTTFTWDHAAYWGRIAYKKWGLSRPGLILINEGALAKHQRRAAQCILHKTTRELIAMNAAKPGRVRELIQAELPYGYPNIEDNVLRPMIINQYSYKDLERIIEEHDPSFVVYDMLDNVQGFEAASSRGTVDARGEMLYQWARDMAIIHDHFAIATSQLSSDGEGIPWPQQKHLKGSRIAKQGACDTIIMLGRNDANPADQERYISTPKEKSELRDPDVNPKTMVTIMPDFTRGYICPNGGDATWQQNSARGRGGSEAASSGFNMRGGASAPAEEDWSGAITGL